MRVVVYVEGPSDKLAMETLLRPLLDAKRAAGFAIDFFEAPEGDRKASVLLKAPVKAANILSNDPDTVVILMPDLYPKNKGFPHETFDELTAGITANFRHALRAKGLADERLVERFKVFCFKHDLEALLLACPDELADRLKVKAVRQVWRVPVEEQDHDMPPKRIVERLFAEQGQKYKDTVDAPLILGRADTGEVVAGCPQCFAPLVVFLEGLG